VKDGEEDVAEDDCRANSCDDMDDGRDEKEDDMKGGGEEDGDVDLLDKDYFCVGGGEDVTGSVPMLEDKENEDVVDLLVVNQTGG